MGNTPSTSSIPSRNIQWMWKSIKDPFSENQPAKWCLYSDVENMIIEEAFVAGKTHALLDDYHIDIEHNREISNNDVNKQRPVKRVVCDRENKRLREERFLTNPVAPDRPYGGSYEFISPFIKEVVKDLNLTKDTLPSKKKTVIPMIVEKAALGIIEEGKNIGKQREAETIAKYLMEKKRAGMKEVWKCCAYLYSMESFLYKKLNETIRSIDSQDHEQVWRNKVTTLGPFCLLLWDNPFDSYRAKPGTILYRGAILSDELIDTFKNDCEKDLKPLRSFQAFTSCTRNRNVAENFGTANVLFIMTTRIAFTLDLSSFSKYVHEEEELLFSGVCFTVDRLKFDKDTNKYLIYLTLQQRHNIHLASQKHQANNNTMTPSQKDYNRGLDLHAAARYGGGPGAAAYYLHALV